MRLYKAGRTEHMFILRGVVNVRPSTFEHCIRYLSAHTNGTHACISSRVFAANPSVPTTLILNVSLSLRSRRGVCSS